MIINKKYNNSIIIVLIIVLYVLFAYPDSKLNSINIKLLGGAQQVSGSSFLIETNIDNFLIDCGIFYPENQDLDYHLDKISAKEKNSTLNIDPKSISSIILTHAHLDHIGKVPLMVKKGFNGKIILTKETAEIANVMFKKMSLKNSDFGLEKFFKSRNSDKYHSHKSCKWKNKIKSKNLIVKNKHRNELIYPEEICSFCINHELNDISSLYQIIDYRSIYNLFDSISIEFYDAKHIPGSASILVTYILNGKEESIYFSGDVGSGIDNILQGIPDNPTNVDYVFIESTYGGYTRELSDNPFHEFYNTINKSINNSELIWIPSFVLDRTQKILNQIKIGYDKGYIDNIPPIYILSSSAKEINKVYSKHYDFKTGSEIETFSMSPRDVSYLNEKPSIIITPSYIDDLDFFHPVIENIIREEKGRIFIVGYQDPRSFGGLLRKIKHGELIKLGDKNIRVNANVDYLGSAFSGHVDELGILNYIEDLNVSKGIFLTHGDLVNMRKLKEKINNKSNVNCEIPDYKWNLNLK
tara:strand:- start:40 stop:1614 length:1575 start_codon:yes stop_codon:yes gene_type:complete